MEKLYQLIKDLIYNYSGRWQLRVFVLAIATTIVIIVIFFTQFIINSLIEKEQKLINAWASSIKIISNPELTTDNSLSNEKFAIVSEIQQNISFPVIITNSEDEPNYPFSDWSLNLDIDTNKTINAQRLEMTGLIEKMKESYDPIIVRSSDEQILYKFYYTNSDLIEILIFFPYLAVISVFALIIFSYVVFNNIRVNQEGLVWVGMSREAAHQLGTPISSLLAWIEILKLSENLDEEGQDALNEMENDLYRLEIIAKRFEKIGARPELVPMKISTLIDNANNYFKKRLPHIGRTVELRKKIVDEEIKVNINPDLFAWVLENLIKNAAESIEKQLGIIELRVERDTETVTLYVKDNGKGMTNQVRKRVFNPGFTTKKRGWGLGLSLCRRIIQTYHKGKIYINETSPGKGTTFVIELPSK